MRIDETTGELIEPTPEELHPRVVAYLNRLYKELRDAKNEQAWEFSKGRVTSGIGYGRLISVLEVQIREMEEVFYGTD